MTIQFRAEACLTRNSVQLPIYPSPSPVVTHRLPPCLQGHAECVEQLFHQSPSNHHKKGTLLSKSSEEDGEDEDEYDEDDMVWLRNSIKACVSEVASEMELDAGTRQKCITILGMM